MKKLITLPIALLVMYAIFVTIASIVSCDSTEEPEVPATGVVAFTYTIPDKLFRYLEIEACWNNDEGTDMVHRPMLDSVFVVRYHLRKLPSTNPVVFMFKRTNRPIPDKLSEIYLDMEVKTDITIGNKTIDEVYTNRYYIDNVNVGGCNPYSYEGPKKLHLCCKSGCRWKHTVHCS